MTSKLKREQSLKAFNVELNDAARQMPAVLVKEMKTKMGLLALRRVIFRTPVGVGENGASAGQHRGGWQVSIGNPTDASAIGRDPDGEKTYQAGKSIIEKAGAWDDFWIFNNEPAIVVLEEGLYPNPTKRELLAGVVGALGGKLPKEYFRHHARGGYSIQAPRGMLAITVEELRQMFP